MATKKRKQPPKTASPKAARKSAKRSQGATKRKKKAAKPKPEPTVDLVIPLGIRELGLLLKTPRENLFAAIAGVLEQTERPASIACTLDGDLNAIDLITRELNRPEWIELAARGFFQR